jgi:uncharacterized membrane protein
MIKEYFGANILGPEGGAEGSPLQLYVDASHRIIICL